MQTQADRDFERLFNSMSVEEKKKLNDKSHWDAFCKSADIIKITKQMVGAIAIKRKPPEGMDMKSTIERFESDSQEISEIYDEVSELFKKIESTVTDESTESKRKVLYSQLSNKIADGIGAKLGYVADVSLRMAFLIPEQNTFRYPEFEPFKVYDETHELVKNFDKMTLHIVEACKCFEYVLSLYQFFLDIRKKK